MKVELVEIQETEKSVLRHLMELYAYDFSEYDNADVNQHGLYGYTYFDYYWTENTRNPFFIKVDGKLAGFCIGWILGEFGQIEPLGVHLGFQGIGLGKALEIAVMNAMWNLGVRRVFIDHVSTNEIAISNSQAIGFNQVNTALRFYVDAKPRG